MSKEKKKDSSLCTVDGCFSERCSKLYCQKHYRRNKLYGDPLVLKNERNDGKCSVSGCHSKSVKKGLCDKHYNRRRIHGDENFDVDERGISLKKRIKRKIIKSGDGCWEWQGFIDETGYGRLKVDGLSTRVHRLSYEAFFGEIPHGKMVLHTCDNRCCCNPKHLYLGTAKDNSTDMMKRGRWAKTDEKRKFLTKEEIIGVVAMLENHTNKYIAEKFKTSENVINNIRKGNTYKETLKTLPKTIQKLAKKGKSNKNVLKGEENPSAILSSAEVIKIRKLYGKGWTITELAKKFDIGRTTVKRIVAFETWRNLSVDPESDELDLHNSHVDGLIARRKKTAKSYLERDAKLGRDNLKVRREAGSGILTEAEVVRIKKLLKKGEMTNTEIGRKFGVTSWAISRIKCGKNWKHVGI